MQISVQVSKQHQNQVGLQKPSLKSSVWCSNVLLTPQGASSPRSLTMTLVYFNPHVMSLLTKGESIKSDKT